MKTFSEFLIESGYVYHRSDSKNHDSIRSKGLISTPRIAKNGVKYKPHINFASSVEDTAGYADDSKIYRVKKKHLQNHGTDPFSKYTRTDVDVPPEHIEFLDNDKWESLK